MAKGRPREFQIDEALDRAMLVFWKKGYRGTSLDDLTEAMAINRPSLYSAFTDKEKLFLSVIDRYRSKFLVKPSRALKEAESLRSGLKDFFMALGNVVLNDSNPPGCMIACLLADESCESDAIKAKLAESIALADANFAKFFEAHKDELAPGLDAATAAKLLTSTTHGLSIRARSGASKREMLKVATSFIGLICAD